jgi:hypothetical protein
MTPPALVLTDGGAEIQLNGVRQWGLDWPSVRQIAIEVIVVVDIGYSEAFWKITGPGLDFGAPVELVVGADEFKARLFAFPGFDRAAYRRAREAEVNAEPGFFICWPG